MNDMTELLDLRNVPDFPGYTVDAFGNVYHNGMLKSLCTREKGMKNYICTSFNGANRQVSAARLICSAFNGRPKPNQMVVYIDGNTDNLAASNLKWGSRKEALGNIYKYRLLTKQTTDKRVKKRYAKENSIVYKLNDDWLIIDSYKSIEEASEALDVPSNILLNACSTNKRLCHYYWCFEEDYYGIGDDND